MDSLNLVNEILRQVVLEVCSQLAFLMGDAVEPDAATVAGDDFLQGSIMFAGPKRGRLTALMPMETAQLLAYSILGIDETDPLEPDAPEDAVREVLNTICGRMMTELYGDSEVFDLSVPETHATDSGAWQQMCAGDSVACNFEGALLLLAFTVSDEDSAS